MTPISRKPTVCSQPRRDVEPEYAPETVNTDGWASTRNTFQTLFPLITVVLCFLHGFLKIRDRCRKACELHRRVWDVYRAATAEEFRRLMNEFQRVRSRQCQGFPRNPGRFHPGSGLSPSLDQLGAIEREASFL